MWRWWCETACALQRWRFLTARRPAGSSNQSGCGWAPVTDRCISARFTARPVRPLMTSRPTWTTCGSSWRRPPPGTAASSCSPATLTSTWAPTPLRNRSSVSSWTPSAYGSTSPDRHSAAPAPPSTSSLVTASCSGRATTLRLQRSQLGACHL